MKNVIFGIGIISFLIFITGCFSKENNYNEELAKIFPTESGGIYKYVGIAEYSHSVVISDIIDKKNTLVYRLDGYFEDGISDIIEDRRFKIEYVIGKDSVKEIIHNEDKYRKKGFDDKMHSIIPNQIILKSPLEEGAYWNQSFLFGDKEYNATTTIVEINTTDSGTKQYKTEIIIDDIPGYFDDKYIELRVYEDGLGLVNFTNTLEQYKFDVDRPFVGDDFLFGYYQLKFN